MYALRPTKSGRGRQRKGPDCIVWSVTLVVGYVVGSVKDDETTWETLTLEEADPYSRRSVKLYNEADR